MTQPDRRSLVVGMPHMVPDQLSEVELLKHVGDFQWGQISDALARSSRSIVNDVGQRLYASFINVETSFSPYDISTFEEGDRIEMAGTIRFYSRQFVEGWVLLDKEETIEDAVFADIETKDDLYRISRPWIYMTNALVARSEGNTSLKTHAPAGSSGMDLPETTEKPTGMVEHEHVLQTGDLELPESRVEVKDTRPIVYEILPENDLNGAGLLYFARYVAMMNYAERILLVQRLHRPVSTQLVRFLCTQHRRTYYFANAAASDRVLVHSTPAFELPGETVSEDPTKTTRGHFVFRHELFRESDGVLMAVSLVRKTLTIPNRMKNLHAETRRLVRSLRG